MKKTYKNHNFPLAQDDVSSSPKLKEIQFIATKKRKAGYCHLQPTNGSYFCFKSDSDNGSVMLRLQRMCPWMSLPYFVPLHRVDVKLFQWISKSFNLRVAGKVGGIAPTIKDLASGNHGDLYWILWWYNQYNAEIFQSKAKWGADPLTCLKKQQTLWKRCSDVMLRLSQRAM